jgi:hypothetical protein
LCSNRLQMRNIAGDGLNRVTMRHTPDLRPPSFDQASAITEPQES